jgi:hypothetical protein
LLGIGTFFLRTEDCFVQWSQYLRTRTFYGGEEASEKQRTKKERNTAQQIKKMESNENKKQNGQAYVYLLYSSFFSLLKYSHRIIGVVNNYGACAFKVLQTKTQSFNKKSKIQKSKSKSKLLPTAGRRHGLRISIIIYSEMYPKTTINLNYN